MEGRRKKKDPSPISTAWQCLAGRGKPMVKRCHFAHAQRPPDFLPAGAGENFRVLLSTPWEKTLEAAEKDVQPLVPWRGGSRGNPEGWNAWLISGGCGRLFGLHVSETFSCFSRSKHLAETLRTSLTIRESPRREGCLLPAAERGSGGVQWPGPL